MEFYAEPVTRCGGITGAGLQNLMGAPHHEQLDVVVRESVQNSWDARLGKDITFEIRYQKAGASQRQAFIDHFGQTDVPEVVGALEASLILTDRKTRGLAGPTRAEVVPKDHRDFVNFVFMIGETKGQDVGSGGSYGYGRSSFFVLSESKMVVVYTRCRDEGRIESRCMGIAWTRGYDRHGLRYTGRHWWGRNADGGPAPLLDEEADAVAVTLGMPTFEGAQTGTSIMVVNPRLPEPEDLNGHSVLDQVESQVLWNCWPHIEDQTIDFVLEWDGERRVPHFAYKSDPRFRLLGRAYRRAQRQSEPESKPSALCRPIKSYRPVRTLGVLSSSLGPYDAGARTVPNGPSNDEPMRHIAMMRNPRIVVEYRRGPEPGPNVEYAGVFVADHGIDEILRRSEPPAHDAWVRERLRDRSDKSAVNLTYTRSKERLEEWLQERQAPAVGGSRHPLGALSEFLGAVVAGAESDGDIGPRSPGTKRKPGTPKPRVDIIRYERKPVADGVLVDVHFEVPPSTGDGRELNARVRVAVDRAGHERAAPANASHPEPVGWFAPDGETTLEPRFPAKDGVRGVYRYMQPRDCVVDCRLSASSLGADK